MIFYSPYTYIETNSSESGKKKHEIEAERYDDAVKYTAHLLKEGKVAFSPIVYGHPIAKAHNLPTYFDYWQHFCKEFIGKCKEFYVLMLDGWRESMGIAAEVKLVNELGVPVFYVNAETYEIMPDKNPIQIDAVVKRIRVQFLGWIKHIAWMNLKGMKAILDLKCRRI